MEEKLIEYADQIVEALRAGVDFAGEQAPLLIQEILTYYLISNSIDLVMGLAGFCTGLYMIRYIILNSTNENSFWRLRKGITPGNEHRVMSFFICGVLSLAFVMQFFLGLLGVIKIIVAPRLYIIEKLSSLL